MSQDYIHLRIADTLAGLATGGAFFVRGLPIPQLARYQGYTTTQPRGRGGQAQHGYAFATITWATLDTSQVRALQAVIDAAEVTGGVGNGTVFLTIPETDKGGYWIDISGLAHLPDYAPIAWGLGALYQNVTLRLNNVTIVNSPSTVI